MAKVVDFDFDSSVLEASMLETRASKGIVKDSAPTNSSGKGVDPGADLNLFKEIAENDVVITTAVDATVDVLTSAGYDFVPKRASKSSKKRAEELLEQFKFDLNGDEILDNAARSLLIYGMNFIEMRSNARSALKELFILETTEMRVQYEANGKITSFWQISNGQDVEFSPDEVIFMRLKTLGSRVYPLWPLEPIATQFATNVYASEYLKTQFTRIPPRIMYVLNNASKMQRRKFIQNLQVVKQNPNADLVAMSEAKIEKNVPSFDEGLLDVTKWLRQQTFAVTRVPPFWLGIVEDSANRGNAEAQIFAFETRIKKLQQIIENAFTKYLLPKMGAKDFIFRFNPFSLKDEKTLIENAQKLKSIGITKERVAEFLTTRGLTIHDEDIEDTIAQDPNDKLNRDLTSMGRSRMDKGTDDMKSNVTQKGTSDLTPEKARDIEQRGLIIAGYDQYQEEVLKEKEKKNAIKSG